MLNSIFSKKNSQTEEISKIQKWNKFIGENLTVSNHYVAQCTIAISPVKKVEAWESTLQKRTWFTHKSNFKRYVATCRLYYIWYVVHVSPTWLPESQLLLTLTRERQLCVPHSIYPCHIQRNSATQSRLNEIRRSKLFTLEADFHLWRKLETEQLFFLL